MSIVRKFKAARYNPTPDIRSGWNYRPWSYGFMRPLHCVPHSINVTNVPQSVLDIFLPANVWATFKRMTIWADFGLDLHPPNPPLGRSYEEGYTLQSTGYAVRTTAQAIANTSLHTRYVIQRQYQLEAGIGVYEENYNEVGFITIFGAQGVDHRLPAQGTFSPFDPTLDALFSLMVSDAHASGNDVAFVHTAQAYIQAPLNLNRLPQ